MLQNKAMLVNLSIPCWDARKYDKKISKDVADQYHTTSDAGRYNKSLVARDAIKAVQREAAQARMYHYKNTLPWSDEGSRILPADNYFDYMSGMEQRKSKWENAVRDFIDSYPDLVNEAKIRLNGLFNPDDYPSIDNIRGKFDFRISILPLPDSTDFRVSLSDHETVKIQADIEKRLNAAHDNAIKDLWDRLYGSIKHISEKLKDPDARFHKTMISNLEELIDLLPRLNVTGNADLDLQIKEARKLIHDPQTLRDNSTLRKQAALDADIMLERMKAYTGG